MKSQLFVIVSGQYDLGGLAKDPIQIIFNLLIKVFLHIWWWCFEELLIEWVLVCIHYHYLYMQYLCYPRPQSKVHFGMRYHTLPFIMCVYIIMILKIQRSMWLLFHLPLTLSPFLFMNIPSPCTLSLSNSPSYLSPFDKYKMPFPVFMSSLNNPTFITLLPSYLIQYSLI